jgi:hypothetical protein
MSVQLDGLNLPQSGQLDIDIRLSATVNITAFAARQKVTGYLADEISTNMHGGPPTLSVGERITWRVPVILSLPPHGDLGEVSHIDVDVETGQMMVSEALIQEIQHRAEALVARPTPQTA